MSYTKEHDGAAVNVPDLSPLVYALTYLRLSDGPN